MRRVIYAAFHPDGGLLTVGVAREPVGSDYPTLYRLQSTYGGVPDLMTLQTIEPFEDWKPIKKRWKEELAKITAIDTTLNDAANRSRREEALQAFRGDRPLLKGSELLPPRKPVLTALQSAESGPCSTPPVGGTPDREP